MKEVSIADLVDAKISGEWGSEPSNGAAIKVLRTTNFTNEGKLRLDSIVERDIDPPIVEKKRLKYGDTIIEKSGGSPNQPVGRVVLFDLNTDEPYLCNNFTAVLRPSKQVNPHYFFWSLFYKHSSQSTLRYQNKTTGILNLKLERYLEEEKIKLPDLITQQKIAGILDQADAARQKRKQASQLTEQFLQSAFLEMFGDPVRNEKGWEVKRFDEISESRLGKMLDGKKQKGLKKYQYLGNSNVKWGEFELDSLLEMEFSDGERNEFQLREGDLLICEGGEIGRCAIWRNEAQNIYFQKAIHRVRLFNKSALPEYIQFLFWYLAKNNGFKDYVSTSTISHLTGVKLKSMLIPIPPLPLQQKFAALVKQVERLRIKQRESERELDNLFQSLMEKYFS